MGFFKRKKMFEDEGYIKLQFELSLDYLECKYNNKTVLKVVRI